MEKSFYIVVAVMIVAIFAGMLSGCASLESKAVAMGHGVDAFSVQTAGSLASGTVLPNIIDHSGGLLINHLIDLVGQIFCKVSNFHDTFIAFALFSY